MSEDVEIKVEADLEAFLATLARANRIVFFAGLPGVGKSLLIREIARLAHGIGRSVHLLQWDLVRPAFASPELEARYPERCGQTHAMIRKAIGFWARRKVLHWDRTHDSMHILIGEVPLVGGRLLDLAQIQDDDAESLLAGKRTVFVTPAPSIEVRTVIEHARSRTFANPAHARESADAPSELLELVWRELHALAVTTGVAASTSDGHVPFDPQAYAAAYRHLLRHRRALTLWLNARLQPRGSVYDLNIPTTELIPTATEASAAVAQLELEYTPAEIEQYVARWFDNV